MISVSNLGKSFGDRVLFAGASFQLNPGERYGLVGANGSGKTTLLGILSGDQDASEGTVSVPKSARLGVLRQDQFLYEEEQVLGVAMMGNRELWDAMVEKEKLLANAHEAFDADRFGELEEIVQRHDGYTAESRAATILEGLGLPAEVHRRPLSTLSGGFKLRVLLAQAIAIAAGQVVVAPLAQRRHTSLVAVLLVRRLLPFRHVAAVRVPRHAIPVVEQVGDVEQLGCPDQLRRFLLVSLELGNAAVDRRTVGGVLVLDDADGNAIDDEHHIRPVALARRRLQFPFPGDVKDVFARTLDEHNDNRARYLD